MLFMALVVHLVTGFIVGVGLTGCATLISANPPPTDWPRLSVSIHRVSTYEVLKRCSKYLTPAARLIGLGLVGGCAEINFARFRCDIWVPVDVDAGVLEHEMDHCFGRDHLGESTLRDAWLTYRSR